ncbi:MULTISPECIES: hypothetical protein [Marivita]|uniref:Uncharacterized protein n=1 Tax=Marivita cryptomonadis TaxID=505252 RepID=A0A9Q2PD45_9RHOB|nr:MULTISPECIES: hypothetical protein [Marivita]MCR9170079.1 hypothetical protein [Paracoccaceae bacterium]MBM2322679.1 hypothetical protein [Marivita cryptomonadis]MBM2332261.1 hypothetical protein [Marivita cryptomonadis]MBM2341845.1 hypothetical protein [Marivita cryptomonadis]MBM2346509.1 hypothetical protein [Marivita cryptomonadis]
MPDGSGHGSREDYRRLRRAVLDLEHVISADSHGYHREIARHLEEIHQEITALENHAARNPP